jgi:uncharacterized protein YqeY
MSTQSLKAQVQADLQDAMRAREKVRAGTLRMVLTAVTNEEVAGEHRELSDDEVLKAIAKEAKRRREAAAAYAEAGRGELVAQEEAELAILETYLPAQLGEAELRALVAQAIDETGATGLARMGQVMKVAQAKVAGRADGGRVAALVKDALLDR